MSKAASKRGSAAKSPTPAAAGAKRKPSTGVKTSAPTRAATRGAPRQKPASGTAAKSAGRGSAAKPANRTKTAPTKPAPRKPAVKKAAAKKATASRKAAVRKAPAKQAAVKTSPVQKSATKRAAAARAATPRAADTASVKPAARLSVAVDQPRSVTPATPVRRAATRPSSGARRPLIMRQSARTRPVQEAPLPTPRERAPKVGTFEQLISPFPMQVQTLCMALRELVGRAVPEARETIFPAVRVAVFEAQGPLGFIEPRRDHARLYLTRGLELEDQDKLLQGGGKPFPYVKLWHLDTLQAPALRALLQSAEALNRTKPVSSG
jgi:hypothetical protein